MVWTDYCRGTEARSSPQHPETGYQGNEGRRRTGRRSIHGRTFHHSGKREKEVKVSQRSLHPKNCLLVKMNFLIKRGFGE
ncbi:hypothetical protein CEXT_462991 [Caerostris extrusa]|uniref:Uncharacterized protein n=1 Tax=Caerostris extrusa TaxID=172846 RepID=A0AAV4XKM7_CAEEX|nr:hypothetical protein CEXT_462991 [Caerostris extrusa]